MLIVSRFDCQEFTEVANNREYYTISGTYKGVPVTVSSHGVGGGGASMQFHELIDAGAKVIIRAGTCGSFQPHLREGSLIVVSGTTLPLVSFLQKIVFVFFT